MKKIIGIDMGHCGIAVATADTKDGKFDKVKNLLLDSHNHTYIIAEVKHGGKPFIYFKAPPADFDKRVEDDEYSPTHGELMADQFRDIMTRIFYYNSSDFSRDEHILLIVGCPASKEWTSPWAREKYEALIKEATGVAEVRVIPESRGGMFSALANGEGQAISAVNGAVVYDFGSLTDDSTFMMTGVKAIEISWNLGASLIDRELYRRICKEAKVVTEALGLALAPLTYKDVVGLKKEVRVKKEEYFNDDLTTKSGIAAWPFPLRGGQKKSVSLMLDDDLMRSILEEEKFVIKVDGKALRETWMDCCKKFFRYSKDRIEGSGKTVKEIVLTGGASRMKFVQDFARKVFPAPRYNVTCSRQPEYSVSRGLVWVGLVDNEEENVILSVKQAVMASGIVNVGSLKESLSKSMGTLFFNITQKAVDEWANASMDESLNQLLARIDNEAKSQKQVIVSACTKCVDTWKDEIRKRISKELERELINKLGTKLCEKIMLPFDIWKKLTEKVSDVSINPERIIENINMDSWFRKLVEGIVFAIAATIALIAVPIPVVNFLVAWFAGKIAKELVSDKDREDLRSEDKRRDVRAQFYDKKQKDDIQKQVTEGVNKAVDMEIPLASLESDIEKIIRNAYEIITLKNAV